MGAVTLYDVLGVRPSATAAEVRRAYLAAARRAHPDIAGPSGEDRMREVNSAWAVLGDADRRAAYDLSLPDGPAAAARDRAAGGHSGPGRARVNRPTDRPFVPFHEVDEDDDDTWRTSDDPTDPATAPRVLLQFAPIVLLLIGVTVGIAGLILRTKPVVFLGMAVMGIGLLAFLFVPLAVMAQASQVEQRRDRDR